MAFSLALPRFLSRSGWKVKIRDRERVEPPHATILRGTHAWRIDLRTGRLLDGRPDPRDVPEELLDFVREESIWNRLCAEWDRMYPANPVRGADDEPEGDDA
jgi:hypothetical protein